MQITLSLIFLSVLIISGCENKLAINNHKTQSYSPAAYLESVASNPQLKPGIGVGNLRLKETRREELFNDEINEKSYAALGISLQFQEMDTLTGIVIDNQTVYRTPDGKKIGLTEKEVIRELGEPHSRGMALMKGEKRIGTLPSLNYNGIVLILSEGERVIQLLKEE